MNHRTFRLLSAGLLAAAALAAAGCGHAPAGPQQEAPKVTVTPAVESVVTDLVEFPGRTEAVEAVEIRARVSGYLEKVNYLKNSDKPGGAEVKVGEVLFEIDPSIYQAEYDRADGQVAVYKAKLDRLQGDVDRNRPLVSRGTISREDFEKMVGDLNEAIAGLKSAKANLESARVNRDFTKVKAPIDGKISRNLITVGNLVKADTTVLATIVSTGKMHVYFDVDENAYLRYQEQVRKGEIKAGEGREGLAEMTLGDGQVVKGGTIDYVDVQLSRTTGTIQVRATFPDPDGLLKAGQFVRIRLPVGEPHKALVVPEVAVGSDQGLKYVYVVADNKVEYRRVTTGDVHDGWQVIEKGLQPGELVIVKGLLRVRDGVTVKAERDDNLPPPAAK